MFRDESNPPSQNFGMPRLGTRRIWDSGAFLNEFCGHISGISREDSSSCMMHFSHAITYLMESISKGEMDGDIETVPSAH